MIGDISNNAISIATYNEREKINKLGLEKFKLEEQAKALKGQAGNEQQLAAIKQQLINVQTEITKTQGEIDRTYGIGSEKGMAIRAVTAALQAAAQNDTAGSLVALASPYLNKTIHEMTAGDTAKDKAANLMAHALLSAVEFQVTGKDPLTGAVAGVTGEVTAQILTQAIYNKTPNQLTANEKENISTLSQLAGGLAAALTAKANGTTTEQGGNFLAAASGAGTAKRAVENNFLSDASRARLNALKTKYHRGEKLTNKEKLEFRDLIESDQRSDVLLDKFRKDPNSLNSKEREAFLSYVDRYYIETVTGNTASGYKLAPSTSLVNAQNRFESEYLINDPVPKRDYGHFPFAGTDAQRSQAVNTLPEESKNWLGWRSEKHSHDEEMYYTVKNELDAPENYKNSANGKIAYSVKDGLEAGSMLALGSGTAVVRGVALMEKTAATVGGEAITLANKGGQVLRLGKDAATKAYIDGQLTYINLVDKGIKAYNTASTKAANAYINGQLAYADAIAKGVNTAKVAAREGIEVTRRLVSEGIYYSYNPTQAKVVRTAVQGIEHGLKPITQMTTNQYVKQAAIGTGVSVATQYSVNGEMNYNDAIKAGFMAPYTLNAPIGMAVLIGSIDTTLSAMADGKSQLNEQIKYGESTLSSYGAEKLTPVIAKPFSPIIGSFVGELINQWNKKLEKEGEK